MSVHVAAAALHKRVLAGVKIPGHLDTELQSQALLTTLERRKLAQNLKLLEVSLVFP